MLEFLDFSCMICFFVWVCLISRVLMFFCLVEG